MDLFWIHVWNGFVNAIAGIILASPFLFLLFRKRYITLEFLSRDKNVAELAHNGNHDVRIRLHMKNILRDEYSHTLFVRYEVVQGEIHLHDDSIREVKIGISRVFGWRYAYRIVGDIEDMLYGKIASYWDKIPGKYRSQQV